MNKKIQAKHIDTVAVLRLMAGDPRPWTHFQHKSEHMANLSEAYPDFPQKVILAKMNALIRRGFVSGCGCGCRGDFAITERGRAAIAK